MFPLERDLVFSKRNQLPEESLADIIGPERCCSVDTLDRTRNDITYEERNAIVPYQSER